MKIKGSSLVKLAGYLTIKTYRDGELVRETPRLRNKVVTSEGFGRNLVLRWISGDAAIPIVIDTASLGDSNTAAADAQTDLVSPLVEDIPITNMSATNNVLNVDVFVSDANLPDDTYEEFGLFMGSRLFARVVISPAYTKASGEDTLFSYELTLAG
jgi:hypothetical protein